MDKLENNVNLLFLIIFCVLIINSCHEKHSDQNKNLSQKLEEINYDSIYLQKKKSLSVEKTLNDAIKENKTFENNILPDEITAIKVVEPILFRIYGKENILKQRPYEIIKQNDYYIINGTMKKPAPGGVFVIIINSKNAKIIELIHGE